MQGISYREDFGAWWPDYDHSPEKCFQFVQQGLRDMDIAIGLCRKKEVCVQAGGHAGFWPKRLAKSFGMVFTFECEPILFECLKRNCWGIDNITRSSLALGDRIGQAKMRPHVSAGGWRIDPEGTFPVDVITIDDLGLSDCDAIFLDIEGYEVEALCGAKATIDNFRPVLHVEELPRSREAIQRHMKKIGYREQARVHGDCIYVGW